MVFFLGIIFGVILSFIFLTIYAHFKLGDITITKKKTEAELEKAKEELKNTKANATRVKEIYARIKEINESLNAISEAAQQPSKNAMHSRYKNGLITQSKELDTEKTELFKELLKLGIDPEIQTYDQTGSVVTMKLSAYLESQGVNINDEPPKQRPKLYLVKNDGDTTH